MADYTVDGVIAKLAEECKQTLAAYKRELQKVRTGRASASLLEGIQVDYYGSRTALSHLAQISAPEARLIVVQVYDAGAVQPVEKAIQSSGLGLNPSREGNMLRISVQPLTQEARKDLVRVLHKQAEEIRVSVRNHRRDANDVVKKVEKDGKFTKDDAKRCLDRIQKQVDQTIAEVDKALQAKEAEVMEV
jgi:ribosome recycling factor